MQNRRNYYRVLHVQPDAPAEIIRTSYRTLMQRLRMHPDLGGDHWNAALINEAFATLNDSVKRASYDKSLKRASTPPNAPPTTPPEPAAASTPASEPGTAALVRSGPGVGRCQFCGTPHSVREASVPGTSCMSCGSPLYPAVRLGQKDRTRRAIDRIQRHIAVSFCLTWPATRLFTGTTEDISISGMRFWTDLELMPNERIRIDCEFCSAIGVVRSARQQARQTRVGWQVGVEFLTLSIKQTRGSLVSKDY